MYNYLMLLMYAIEQERDRENNRKAGTKTQAQLAKERIGDLKKLLGDDSPEDKDPGVVTIEVTPEDMKKAKKEKKEREKMIQERRLGVKSDSTYNQKQQSPSRTKPPRSAGK